MDRSNKKSIDTAYKMAIDAWNKLKGMWAPGGQFGPLVGTVSGPVSVSYGSSPITNRLTPTPTTMPTMAPTPIPIPTLTPTPAAISGSYPSDRDSIAQNIAKGLGDYAAYSASRNNMPMYTNPLASVSGEMADLGIKYGIKDPYLPATINLKEGWGNKPPAGLNNYFSWGSTKPLPDIYNSINSVYHGIGRPGGLYQKWLETGDVRDFLGVYTPEFDHDGNRINPPMSEQVSSFNNLRKYFPQ